MSSRSNPLGLSIGDKVMLRGARSFEYDDNGNRDSILSEFKEPREFFVVGVCKKAVGKYEPGHATSNFGVEYEDYKQPCLVVDHYVRVYECKESMTDRTVRLAQSEDIEILRTDNLLVQSDGTMTGAGESC